MSNSDLGTLLSIIAIIISGTAALSALRGARLSARESRRIASLDILRLVEATRQDRYVVRRSQLPRMPTDPAVVSWDSVPTEILDSFERVARTFDIVGAFDRLHLISHEFVDVFHSSSFQEMCANTELLSYVEWRRRAQPYVFWELVMFYERTKAVWVNHPANTGRQKWPRNPRRFERRFWSAQWRPSLTHAVAVVAGDEPEPVPTGESGAEPAGS